MGLHGAACSAWLIEALLWRKLVTEEAPRDLVLEERAVEAEVATGLAQQVEAARLVELAQPEPVLLEELTLV